MADNVEKIVSVTEWYKHYHQENKINNNTKIENIKATIGGFKMWFYFSIFSVILMLLCFILGPIVDKLMNAETSNDMFFICFVGVPIVSFFVFTIPTVISILMRKKIKML